MTKYKRIFNDYFEQCFYQALRREGYTNQQAIKETRARFTAYDTGKDIIFVK